MSDIVERLNLHGARHAAIYNHTGICGEAAAEITRLRDEVERLREAGIALALDAGNLSVAMDGQEKYREHRQAVLRSMVGFQAALPTPRAALDG